MGRPAISNSNSSEVKIRKIFNGITLLRPSKKFSVYYFISLAILA